LFRPSIDGNLPNTSNGVRIGRQLELELILCRWALALEAERDLPLLEQFSRRLMLKTNQEINHTIPPTLSVRSRDQAGMLRSV
jgi:hypothetical protein